MPWPTSAPGLARRYIVEDAAAPAHVRVVVTQPRRIAAVTLAKRVAEQLGEPVGRSVGYL